MTLNDLILIKEYFGANIFVINDFNYYISVSLYVPYLFNVFLQVGLIPILYC